MALASWPVSDCSQELSLSCATGGLQWTEQLQDKQLSGGACGPWVPAAALPAESASALHARLLATLPCVVTRNNSFERRKPVRTFDGKRSCQ